MEGFEITLSNHRLVFTPGNKRLVVTFDNAGASIRKSYDREPWGHKFLHSENGFSVLGAIPQKNDWYRAKDLHVALENLAAENFFRNFDDILFLGSSMGGYAAAAFSNLSPGSKVLIFNPQSSLAYDIVPWETRHKRGREQNWEGAYADATREVSMASKVSVFYDPFNSLDKRHALRFSGPNIDFFRTPFLGHALPGSFHQMGILKKIIINAFNESLSVTDFYNDMRSRRELLKYWKELSNALISKNRFDTGLTVCDYALEKFGAEYFKVRKQLCLAGMQKGNLALQMLDESGRRKKRVRNPKRRT